ncbi:hypothetical protein L6452_17641 [Arctium lappa]|uniref:Uncharacterized protein n=1 Tax=Arctium lappa TaxID=4217 RepID=A0ACB9C436_ARCLA|nr:hypothetical protein L6452_17641 [Arctium lappa]
MHYISTSKLSNWVSKIKESSFNGRWQQVLSFCNESGVLQLTEPSLFHPILKACSAISFNHGKSLHGSVIKLGVESCTSIGNSIMDLYAKAGEMGSTFSVFGCMKIKDSVSWNILISGHLHHGDMDRGICLFMQARATGFAPNISTLVLVIQTIRNLGALCEGQKMHGYIIKTRFLAILSVQNSLLSMYTDMAMEFARKLFDEMSNRDVITWSVMISGYVKSNESCVALGVFRDMLSQLGTEVDGQTIVSALKACTDLNDLITGRMLHGFIFRKVSNQKHSEAVHLFDSMQKVGMEPDAVTLVNLLQPNNSGGYMLASSMYAARGLWADAARIRALVRDKHVKIVAGYSMVHVNDKSYRFIAGDRNQCLSNEIQTTVEDLHECMKTKKSWIEVPTYIQV